MLWGQPGKCVFCIVLGQKLEVMILRVFYKYVISVFLENFH